MKLITASAMVAIIALTSCSKDFKNGRTKFVVENTSSQLISKLGIYLQGYNDDSLIVTNIAPGTTARVEITAKRKGEGGYHVKAYLPTKVVENRFGYFAAGSELDNVYHLEVQADSMIYHYNK